MKLTTFEDKIQELNLIKSKLQNEIDECYFNQSFADFCGVFDNDEISTIIKFFELRILFKTSVIESLNKSITEFEKYAEQYPNNVEEFKRYEKMRFNQIFSK